MEKQESLVPVWEDLSARALEMGNELHRNTRQALQKAGCLVSRSPLLAPPFYLARQDAGFEVEDRLYALFAE